MCNHSTCKLTQISWAVDEKTSSLLASTLPAYVKLDGIDSTLREAVIKLFMGSLFKNLMMYILHVLSVFVVHA